MSSWLSRLLEAATGMFSGLSRGSCNFLSYNSRYRLLNLYLCWNLPQDHLKKFSRSCNRITLDAYCHHSRACPLIGTNGRFVLYLLANLWFLIWPTRLRIWTHWKSRRWKDILSIVMLATKAGDFSRFVGDLESMARNDTSVGRST